MGTLIRKIQTIRPWLEVATGLGVILGGLLWLSTLHTNVSANTEDVREIRKDQRSERNTRELQRDAILDTLSEIKQRQSNIEGKLDILLQGR